MSIHTEPGPPEDDGQDTSQNTEQDTGQEWPEDGSTLPPPEEVAEPQFDDLGDGGDYEREPAKSEHQREHYGEPG